MTNEERNNEALGNACNGQSVRNYAAIFEGFGEKGIPESEILPRVNIYTYRAWKALDRQVMKGEKGVRVITFVPMTKKSDKEDEKPSTFRRPRTTTVFHISQTKEVE